MKRENFHLKKGLNTITKNKENNSTIETKFNKHGKKKSMYDTVEECGEETIIKGKITTLTSDNTTSLQSDNV